MSRRPIRAVLGLGLLLTGFAAVPDAPPAATALTDLYGQMQWRLVGPFRGGWSTMAEGVPAQPSVFYFGTADGGLWKSVDAGLSWKPLFQDAPSISIGALAVAPSNPDVLYIGTGQPEMRYDIVDGNGVYRSDDGGQTWRSLGLQDTRHIGRIWVDPRNADVVTVAALGHIFGPNEERGVFRSEDGGKHWTKVLYVDADAGAVDLAADPAKPDVIFAATWQIRELPWLSYYLPDQGPGSGIWKSVDGGKTWARVTGNGLPTGELGRVGLAVAPGTNAQRVYAIVGAAADKDSGLYRSDDGGAHWQAMGGADLASSYFDRVTVDPKDPDVVYVMNRSVARSTDGGKTFNWFKGAPGGDDYHFLWINPRDSRYMVLASDQGTTVSVDAGKSWSSWYNQPTGQFYHVVADDRFPYHLYSGQQDSGTVDADSASDYGELTFRDWRPVGGDERSYVIPDNKDPEVVYVGGLGGHVSRYDGHTGQVQNISAWPITGYGKRPTTVKYHYNWFYPLVADPHAPHTLYLGGQYLFKSSDGGLNWTHSEQELNGADPQQAHDCDKDPLKLEQARACGYGNIFSIAPSPRRAGLLWTGSDDGFIYLTRDGGRHWQDVTPKDMPLYGRVNQVEASPTDPATAYAAMDTHRQDLFKPYIYRTHDYGRTWEPITTGIPDSQYVYVVRQDPVDPKLLYAGTNSGVFVSFDDGDHWQPLQLNLPTARVRDLTVHGDDLIAATQGRALWVLDDVTPLRQVTRAVLETRAHMFAPAAAVRVRRDENKDTPLPPEEPAGANPPEGAVLDYWLGQGVTGPVTLEIDDAAGKLVRRFASDAEPATPHAEVYFNAAWLTPAERLPADAGAHRFVWDLRYPRPPSLNYDYSIAAVHGRGGALLPEGPLVLPGRYTVKLSAGGETSIQTLLVVLDPRVSKREAKLALPQQLELAQRIGADMAASYAAHDQVAGLRDALKALKASLSPGTEADLIHAVETLDADAERLESTAPDKHNFAAINAGLSGLAAELGDGDRPPPRQYREAYKLYSDDLQQLQADWHKLQQEELMPFNRLLQAHGRAPLPGVSP
jgi:photosystem II stability/assembly factor-like uncharacterized protein